MKKIAAVALTSIMIFGAILAPSKKADATMPCPKCGAPLKNVTQTSRFCLHNTYCHAPVYEGYCADDGKQTVCSAGHKQ